LSIGLEKLGADIIVVPIEKGTEAEAKSVVVNKKPLIAITQIAIRILLNCLPPIL
ncbi:unnamed protein product, partial [marine sediment metagenome]